MRRKLLQLLPYTVGAVGVSNEDFILMHFPKDIFETECVWLLGNFMELVEAAGVGTGKILRPEQVKGVLKNRLNMMQERSVIRPNIIL